MNREHWVNPPFAHIMSILQDPFFSVLDIEEDFVELKMVQRRTKRNDQKYSMAQNVGMANRDEQLKLEGCP